MANSSTGANNQCFRWLHISDLHVPGKKEEFDKCKNFIKYILDGTPDSCDDLEEKGIKGIIKEYCNKRIDCIVITGDCFNRGDLSENAEAHVVDIVRMIYQTCNEISEWGWEKNHPMDRLCYCPGNHDLARDENVRNRKGRNELIYRKDVISEAASSKSAFLSIADSSKRKLVVDQSFDLFHSAMKKATNNASAEFIGDGQVICFYPDAPNIESNRKVVFIGLNTALLAGQVASFNKDESFDEYATKKREEIKQCLQSNDYSGVFSKAKELKESCQVANGERIEDEGKMCLPEENVFNILGEKLKDGKYIPVLFGHHGIRFLKPEARDTLNDFVNRNNIPAYLCGHAHQMRDVGIGGSVLSRFPNQRCLEVTAGGLFWDKTAYNQIGFSIGTIELTDSSYITTIDHYACVQFHGDTDTASLNAGIWTKGTSKKEIRYRSVTGAAAKQDSTKEAYVENNPAGNIPKDTETPTPAKEEKNKMNEDYTKPYAGFRIYEEDDGHNAGEEHRRHRTKTRIEDFRFGMIKSPKHHEDLGE